MWIDETYRLALEQAGLTDVDSVLRSQRGRRLRALADRENWYLTLDDPHLGPRGAYLKKHHIRDGASWLRAALGMPAPETPARVEAQYITRLSECGVPTMRLLAFGEARREGGLSESFLLTEELTGFVPLDDFLRDAFTAAAVRNASRDRRLQTLIRTVAGLARRFHTLGFNHRDFYCCHFFVAEPRPCEFHVRLIDLQRVQHRTRWRQRWIVKDLAQLAYSVPRDRLTCSQKMAFIKAYFGVRTLRPGDKKLVRRVVFKQQWMQRRLGESP